MKTSAGKPIAKSSVISYRTFRVRGPTMEMYLQKERKKKGQKTRDIQKKRTSARGRCGSPGIRKRKGRLKKSKVIRGEAGGGEWTSTKGHAGPYKRNVTTRKGR